MSISLFRRKTRLPFIRCLLKNLLKSGLTYGANSFVSISSMTGRVIACTIAAFSGSLLRLRRFFGANTSSSTSAKFNTRVELGDSPIWLVAFEQSDDSKLEAEDAKLEAEDAKLAVEEIEDERRIGVPVSSEGTLLDGVVH